MISSNLINEKLRNNNFLSDILIFDELDSTNEYLKREIKNVPDKTLAIADVQSAGKGSKGRSWSSPAGSGIWMSFMLRPDIPMHKAPMLTLVMSVSIAKALQKLYNLPVAIKWPNDIVCSGRKLCGILSEMKQLEDGFAVIIGLGINVSVEKFSDELKERATSIYLETGKSAKRSDIIAEIIKCFEKDYEAFIKCGDLSCIIDDYTRLSITVGQTVKVHDLKSEYEAKVLGIGNEGQLMVEREDENGDKKRVLLYGGEVSVRGIYGYV